MDADAVAAMELWGDMQAVQNLGLSVAVWNAATDGLAASDRAEAMWRVVWLERWAARRRQEQERR